MVARPLNVRPGFSEVYDKHEVQGLADWVGGCRGGILGVEGDTPYLIRHWPVFTIFGQDSNAVRLLRIVACSAYCEREKDRQMIDQSPMEGLRDVLEHGVRSKTAFRARVFCTLQWFLTGEQRFSNIVLWISPVLNTYVFSRPVAGGGGGGDHHPNQSHPINVNREADARRFGILIQKVLVYKIKYYRRER